MKILPEKYKGIHPGAIINRELKNQNIKKSDFARRLGEYPQVINEITKQRRGLPTLLALKMEKELGMKEGELVLLQTFYDIKRAKEKLLKHTPDLSVLRAVLFWDTDIQLIEWENQANAVIKRVFHRGNEMEKEEIIRFYGKRKVHNVLNQE